LLAAPVRHAQTADKGAIEKGMPAQSLVASVGILWRGNPDAPPPTREENRLGRVFDELEAIGVVPVPIVFAEEVAGDVRRTLATLDGVLVWVDPVVRGRDRSVLDAMRRCRRAVAPTRT
jgi:hypothetical protein